LDATIVFDTGYNCIHNHIIGSVGMDEI